MIYCYSYSQHNLIYLFIQMMYQFIFFLLNQFLINNSYIISMNFNQNPMFPPANYQFCSTYMPSITHPNNINYPFYSTPPFNQYAPNMGNYMFPMNQQQFNQPNDQLYKLNYQGMRNPYSFNMDPNMNQVRNSQNLMMNINSNYDQNKLRDKNKIVEDKNIIKSTEVLKNPYLQKNILKTQQKQEKIYIKTDKLNNKQSKKKHQIIILDDEQIHQPKLIQQVKIIQRQPQTNSTKTFKKKILKEQTTTPLVVIKSKRNRFPSSKLELQQKFLKNSLVIRVKRSKKVKQQSKITKFLNVQQLKVSENLYFLKKKADSKIMVGDKYQAVIPDFMFNQIQFKQIKQRKKQQLLNRKKKIIQNYLEVQNKIMAERIKVLGQELIHIRFSENQYYGYSNQSND